MFDEQVKVMDRELFHIALTEDAKAFCVKRPCKVLFAFREKLKAELEILQYQGIK